MINPILAVTFLALAQAAPRPINVVAHEDDDLLFINPDIQADIASGRPARTIFVTAGNQGCYQNAPFWQMREAGMKLAYAQMAGVASSWTETTLHLGNGCSFKGGAGTDVALSTLNGNPGVSLVFLRLPSAWDVWGPFELWSGAVSSISSPDPEDKDCPSSPPVTTLPLSVTKDGLTCLIASAISSYGATSVRTLDPTGTGNHDGDYGDDHREHYAVANFALAANRTLPTPLLVSQHRGYNIQYAPQTLFAEAAAKYAAFDAYARFDTNEFGVNWAPTKPGYLEFTSRQYLSRPFGDDAVGVGPTTAGTFSLGDVNGDGKPDACIRTGDGVHCGTAFGASATLFQVSPQIFATDFFSDANGWGASEYGTTIQLGDVNGDGLSDVCGRGVGGIWCALSTGVGFAPASLWIPFFTDAQGWNTGAAYYGSIRLADVNGDGKADVCGRGGAGIWCALSTGAGFGAASLWIPFFTDAQGWNALPYGTTIQLGDVNGDGKADVCGRGIAGIWCALSTGAGFGAASLWSAHFSDAEGWTAAWYYPSIRIADANGDGKADVCGRGVAGILCAASNGQGFGALTLVTTEFSDANGWAAPQYGSTIKVVPSLQGPEVCGRGGNEVICARPSW
ncbi:MAG TPA: VCBS repeat-containing protein [Thermoanaerobaculia bacterium]|nr:VCBS repeat-containing protein [Thermoanaerobaculia bacterium]